MAEVVVRAELGASAEKVWRLIRDFGGIAKWAGAALQSCELEGEGIGAVRTIGLPGGAAIRERLEAYDEDARTLSYSIIGQSPLPIRDYLSTMKVEPAGSNRCTLEWSGRFEPAGVDDAQASKIVQGVYDGGVAGIKAKLGA